MYPLRFVPFLRPMVWGGRSLLERLHKPLPDERPYGESWEVSDHPLHRSVVANGPLQGQTLRQLMEQHRAELLGDAAPNHTQFPWLIKFLDCHDWLSVQVHPDEQAVKILLPGEGSKTEAWFVLDAAPGSKIYAGLRPGVDESVLRRALANGTVAECLHSFTPRAGDCVFLPAGTVHAVGGGVLMAEVQQTSDATFRLYDWDRRDAEGKSRQLHLEESMHAIHWDQGPVTPVHVENLYSGDDWWLGLVGCQYFGLDFVHGPQHFDWPGGRLQAAIILQGTGQLVAGQVVEPVSAGQVWLLPAVLGKIEFAPQQRLDLLICRLP